MRRRADVSSLGRRRGRSAASLAALVLALLLTHEPASAEPIPVDLQLVLAVDVSRSMDYDEQRLQRDGYVEAFLHADVLGTIRAGSIGRIAVTYVEWAGSGRQQVIVPWTLIDGPAAAEAFGRRIMAAPILGRRRTSISGALSFGSALFDKGGFTSSNKVIDVSGDGPNNSGLPVTMARDYLVSQGIVINGLPIMLRGNTPAGFFDISDLDLYYEDCVIGGFGAFIVTVREASEFAAAIRRKLILEIAGASAPKLLPTQHREREPTSDCLIGEKRWQEYISGQE